MHLAARIVPYSRPDDEFSWEPGPIDMRRYWAPEPDSASPQSVELYVPGTEEPLYRGAPYPGATEEQVRAAVRHYIACGVYTNVPARTRDALRECALSQRPTADHRSNLDSMFAVGMLGSEGRYGITLSPPAPMPSPKAKLLDPALT